MEVEHCIRVDGEEIRNFQHRIKTTVDKEWPDDMEGVAPADHGAERNAQARQRRQGYIDYSMKKLRPNYPQRKAQHHLMKNPNATWNDFSTRIIQRDVSFQVSSNFLNDEEQNKAQMATVGQEMKNFRSEPQEHPVNAVERNPRTVDPNQKGTQNATRFCNYCRTNGHTPSWCRKKILDEELKCKTEELPRKKSPFFGITTKNEDQIMDQNNGLEAKVSKKEIRITIMIDLQEVFPYNIRTFLQGQPPHMRTIFRTKEDHMIYNQISHLIETMEIDLEMDLSTNRMGTGETMETFHVLHRLQGEDSHKQIHTANQQLINPTTLPSADLTINLRLVLHRTNKFSHKTIIRYHPMWSSSPQPTTPLLNYQIFVP